MPRLMMGLGLRKDESRATSGFKTDDTERLWGQPMLKETLLK